MARAIWKGAISFGLVNVPVSLFPASTTHTLDLDWLDKRTMSPVGYKRVNKENGKEVPRDQIVHGYEYEKGNYVVLSDDDIRSANPAATQTVDILAFVNATDVSFMYLDTPYYLVPERGGAKAYALLHAALIKAGKLGIARVVMHTRAHLAVLAPAGDALVLDTLRWQDEMRDPAEVGLTKEKLGKLAAPAERELEMAIRLIDEMSGPWRPGDYHDTFQDDLKALIDRKIASGQTREVAQIEASAPQLPSRGNVTDLMALLRQSLGTKDKRAAVTIDAQDVDAKASGSGKSKSAKAAAKPAKPSKTTKATKAKTGKKATGKPSPAKKAASGKASAKRAKGR
ncbi:non-homologous end joining protein Ku [Pandoraea fibrosis]|uniref:Non-homologous end joining protein Ku n=1 Tax=Pandoraea fibrosis TaxID=1891094 RepID=A0A5E4TS61_9BURK|nr:Ku protein [Pandoraea fibrosis]VVD90052.1 Ku protein [Pandoraea fibrosis]